MKNVQITYELFLELIKYHLLESDADTEKIKKELTNKIDALVMPQMEEYQGIFDRNANEVQDLLFVQRITNQIQQQMSKKMEKEQSSSNSFKTYFRYLLKAIADYQEEVIETNFIGLSDNEIIRTARKQTFLSYAYYDKGLTQALFYYFWLRSGFLYVNWMWDGANNHSSATKKKLEYALKDSNAQRLCDAVMGKIRSRYFTGRKSRGNLFLRL